MHVAFRSRAACGPLLWTLLTIAVPAEANQGTAAICAPPPTASSVDFPGALPRLSRIAAIVAVSPNPNPAVKLLNAGKRVRWPPAGLVSVNRPRLPPYGCWREKLVQVKSIGGTVKIPEDGLHKGILEFSTGGGRPPSNTKEARVLLECKALSRPKAHQ